MQNSIVFYPFFDTIMHLENLDFQFYVIYITEELP